MVLIIDGNVDEIQVITRACQRVSPDLEILYALDGQEAMDLLSDPSIWRRVRLVFLSLRLSRRPGLEVLETLRSSDESWAVPVVVVEGAVTQTDLNRVYEAGANRCLSKPQHRADFEAMVHTEADFWCGLDRTRWAAPSRA